MDIQPQNATSVYYGFHWTDYTVFVMMFVLSIIIGIYFGCFGSKQKSPIDYLLGGKTMDSIPVALSLIASMISASMLIGVPAEVYTENPSYWLTNFSLILACIVAYYFYIPPFYEFKMDSAYEYLEMRFNKKIRSIASWCYFMTYLVYLPTVIYVPSLTLSLVTGVNLHIITTSVTVVCIFYTMIGGLKAVIWTDFFQIIVTLLACIAIIIIGTINAGGIAKVMKIAYDDGKLNIFNMNPNPFVRNSFMAMFAGGFFSNLAGMSVSQATIQRYISLKSSNNLLTVLIIFCIGSFLIVSMCIYGGLLLYAVYYGCDPIKNNMIQKADQIYPHYIIYKMNVPALPGLFVSGVFGAALSSLSTGLNTMTGVIYDEYVKSRVDDKKANTIMKLITLLIGIFSICTVFLIEKMGKTIAVSYIVTSITFVPVLVIFTLGMMVPNCNTKGAFAGIISSILFLGWVAIGSIVNEVNFITPEIYPKGINTCPALNQTDTTISTEEVVPNDIFPLYNLSYMLYTMFGLIVGLFFGIITSYLTGPIDPATLDPRLISPPLRRFLPKNTSKDNNIVLDNLIEPIN